MAPGFISRDITPKGPVRDAQQLFYKTFNAQNIDPDVGNSQSWDPTLIIIDALKHAGTNATPKAILDYIETLHDYPANVRPRRARRAQRRKNEEHVTNLVRSPVELGHIWGGLALAKPAPTRK